LIVVLAPATCASAEGALTIQPASVSEAKAKRAWCRFMIQVLCCCNMAKAIQRWVVGLLNSLVCSKPHGPAFFK
jgi:hypothetical protein